MEAATIGKLLAKPLESLFTIVEGNLKQVFSNRILEYSTEEYKRNFFCKTLLHRAEPIPLNVFYQPLCISKYGENERLSTESPSNLFVKNRKITIVGNAGSGKSTILKYLVTKCYIDSYKIPIKLELRYLNEYNGSVTTYILNEIFTFYELGFNTLMITKLLNNNSFVFLFDGYDEINYNSKMRVTRELNAFIAKFPHNNYIVTSRPYSGVEDLPMFSNFSVCELSDEEVKSFVIKQIPPQETEIAKRIISAITDPKNSSYKSFISNPLLLSMFILTYQSYAELPQNKNIFYRQVFEALFALHDSMSKMAFVREKISGLSKDQFENILKLFSYRTFFQDKFIFSVQDLSDNLDFIKLHKKISFENQKLISDLQVAIGIINQDGLEYSFPHRSLQEYFATLFIKDLVAENKMKFYKNQVEQITQDGNLIFHRANLYSLLNEVDFSFMVQNLSIPILRHFIRDYAERIYYYNTEINILEKELTVRRDDKEIDAISLKLRQYLRRKTDELYIIHSEIHKLLLILFRANVNYPKLYNKITGQDPNDAETNYMHPPSDKLEQQFNYIRDSIGSFIMEIDTKISFENESDLQFLYL